MRNVNLDFYEEFKMAPEIGEDEDGFCKKRQKLYRQLGIPLISFRNANVVEFGPNRGNNALTLLTGFYGKLCGVKHIDLVEPNPYGREEMRKLFQERKIEEARYAIYPDMLEDFDCGGQQYDFIIAEEFIHYIPAWKELIQSIKRIASENTVIIITCTNEIGIYIERMKRLTARFLVRNFKDREEQIKELEKVFEPQLRSMKWMSRSFRSYILDMFFDEVFLTEETMSIVDAIDAFGAEYDVLGCSQNIFIDHSWFKDLSYDYISSYKEQYHRKKHMYMLAGDTQESIRTIEENDALEKAVIHANRMAAGFEKEDRLHLQAFQTAIEAVTEQAKNERVARFNEELMEILWKLDKKEQINLSDYAVFSDTFGEGSQYVSFVKK